MFPGGWPGVGLLLLRGACGAVFIAQGAAYFGDDRQLGFVTWSVTFVTIVVGLLLLIGFLTRFAAFGAGLIGVSSILSWLPRSSLGPLETPTTAGLSAIVAIAVICMGAGALSIDARIFGRREIIIPASSAEQ